MDLSIIIANYNHKDLLEGCIPSIYKHTKGINYEIIVIDDCSTDESVDFIKKNFPKVKLIVNEKNLGPIVANNLGIMNSKGRYCLLFNNDTITKNNVFSQMVEFMDKNPEVGVTGPNLIYKNGSFQKSCGDIFKPARKVIRDYLINIILPKNEITDKNKFSEEFHKKISKVSYINGACYMIRREAIEQVGLVDEQYYMYAEEMDWQYRIIKKGWKLVHLPYGPVVHFGGTSGINNRERSVSDKFKIMSFRNMLLFYKKNYGFLSYTLMRFLMLISLSRNYLKSKITNKKDNLIPKLIKTTLSNIKINTFEPKIRKN